jgi:hypothetical protein
LPHPEPLQPAGDPAGATLDLGMAPSSLAADDAEKQGWC